MASNGGRYWWLGGHPSLENDIVRVHKATDWFYHYSRIRRPMKLQKASSISLKENDLPQRAGNSIAIWQVPFPYIGVFVPRIVG
jgi:hypothetical protein